MAVRQIKAEDTSMVFGRGPNITDRNDLVKKANRKIREYLVTSWEHDEDSDLLENQALSPGRAGVSDEINFLWGSGPFSVQVPSEDGYLDLVQALLNDPKPVSVAIPDKTLVAAKTKVSDILAENYFTHTTIAVVADQALSGAGAKTIANNLSDAAAVSALTVTPNSSAGLTDSNTPATVVIDYTDADSAAHKITLTFPDTAKTVAQTAPLPAGATITSVKTTGWNAGNFDITAALTGNAARNPEPDRPGQLRVKYTGDLSGHTLLIRGVRRVGLGSKDTLPMRESIELGADVRTEKYFHKIHTVEVKDENGVVVKTFKDDADHTIEVIAEPGGYETTLKVVNDDPEGLTFEADVGGEPRVVSRGIVIGGEIEIGDTIGATYNLLSSRVDKRQTIEERDEPQFTSMMAKDRDEHPTDLEARDFERVTSRFYSGHGRYLELDGEAVICNSVGLNIEHNYDFVQGKVPGMFRRDTEATARRLTTASVNTNYESGSEEADVFVRWDEKYRNREKVNVRVGTYQWLGNGKQLSVTYRMRNCDIQSPVRVPATGPGVVPVTVELKALPLEGQIDGEIEVIIVSDDEWPKNS
ncbi:MAG: hypothetical protein OXL96_24420 [Candidatus Poribacteria bacterium]|nr:hypothetical protein [Candidatus Poribacteria bacterium]